MSQSQPAPKTEGSKQTGFLLGAGMKPVPVLMIDPDLCRFAASPCRWSDGLALAMELHTIGLAPSLVSGWFSTVAPDAGDDDLVTPRFERLSGVTLWRALLANLVGRRNGDAP